MTRFGQSRTPPGDFEVVIEASGRSVEVTRGESILDALEDAGFTVPWLCRSGFCGTCVVDVVAGTPEHHGSAVAPADPNADSAIAVCVSRSLTPRLTISLQ